MFNNVWLHTYFTVNWRCVIKPRIIWLHQLGVLMLEIRPILIGAVGLVGYRQEFCMRVTKLTKTLTLHYLNKGKRVLLKTEVSSLHGWKLTQEFAFWSCSWFLPLALNSACKGNAVSVLQLDAGRSQQLEPSCAQEWAAGMFWHAVCSLVSSCSFHFQ